MQDPINQNRVFQWPWKDYNAVMTPENSDPKPPFFEVDLLNDRGKKVLSDVREIPFQYRGRQVVLKALELNMCELVAKLVPRYVLKI